MNKRSSGSTGSSRQSLVPQRVQRSSTSRDSTGKPTTRMSTGSRSSFSGTSSFGGRASFAASGRPSLTGIKRPLAGSNSAYGQSATAKKRKNRYSSSKSYGVHKDPRPITDRAYKDQCVRALIEFLVARGYSHPISPKLLHSPQTKDFVRIFEFLVGNLLPKYRVVSKMEEEIPRMLRILGYPFSISRSAMYAVGSPHTWPTLLAALVWLKSQIEYALGQEADTFIFPEDDFDSTSTSEKKLMFDYSEETYKRFMNFEDDFTDLDEKLSKQIIKQNGAGGEVEHLATVTRQKSEELEMLKQQPDPLMSSQERLATMELDEQKLQQYLDELEHRCQKFEHKQRIAAEENVNLEAELEGLLADNARKEKIFETQEFSQEDIQRVKLEQQALTQQTESVDQEGQTLDKHIWQAEMAISKLHEKTAATIAEYSRVGESLHLIPMSAENAFGIDYELKATFSEQQMDRCNNFVKPGLTQIKQESTNRVMEAVERKSNQQESLEHYHDLCQEKEEAIKSMQIKMKRTEDEIQGRKDMKQRETQNLQAKIEILHLELTDLRHSAQTGVHELRRQFTDERSRMEEKKTARNREEKKAEDFVVKAVTIIADHKQEIQDHMKKVVAISKKDYEDFAQKWG